MAMPRRLKKRLTRSRLLLGLGRNFLPYIKLSNRHKRLLLHTKRSVGFTQIRSNFALQLKAKQKLAAYYGALPAKQLQQAFQNTVYKNARQIQPAESVVALLESRLDVVLVRANWAISLNHSRQLIAHQAILVNNQKVCLANYILEAGDVVQMNSRYFKRRYDKNFSFLSESLFKHDFDQKFQDQSCNNSSHLEINYKTRCLVFLYHPQYLEWPIQLDFALLARYFQRH